MPQMMPINWLMIFLMCLTCLFITIILMNALLLYMKMKDINNNKKNNNKKNNSNSKKKKKWEWSW
nr:TPA_asm: ATP8 [Bombus pratorum]